VLEGLDAQQRLFVVGHWSAATLTERRLIRCDDVEVSIPVARRLPLLACKLHAWLDRRDARADKRGSDGLDIVRLIETAQLDELAAGAAHNRELGQVVGWAAAAVLIDQSARVSRMISLHTDTPPPGAERVELLGSLLVDAINS